MAFLSDRFKPFLGENRDEDRQLEEMASGIGIPFSESDILRIGRGVREGTSELVFRKLCYIAAESGTQPLPPFSGATAKRTYYLSEDSVLKLE